jgi:uncharacterized protein (TIGR00730 family)
MTNLLVYCGSRHGTLPTYTAAARQVAIHARDRSWGIVYGGGGVGLMGELARTAVEHDVHVTGIIPHFLCTAEVLYRDVTEHIVVQSMHERKLMMMERAHMILALPGGFGTMEELFEAVTWLQLGLHAKPIGVLNVDGFYDHLEAQFTTMLDHGFLTPHTRSLIRVDNNLTSLLDFLEQAASPEVSASLESRI